MNWAILWLFMERKTMDHLTGGCMCGAVRYETTGEATGGVIHCHCQSCRKHTGAPMATLAVFGADMVTFSGDERGIHDSAPGVGRGFCANCGTPLTWETVLGDQGAVCAIHISTFDDPNALTPTGHSFYGERLSGFDVVDNLPRYEGFIAGGTLLRHGPAD
jgi:hypothetical protein